MGTLDGDPARSLQPARMGDALAQLSTSASPGQAIRFTTSAVRAMLTTVNADNNDAWAECRAHSRAAARRGAATARRCAGRQERRCSATPAGDRAEWAGRASIRAGCAPRSPFETRTFTAMKSSPNVVAPSPWVPPSAAPDRGPAECPLPSPTLLRSRSAAVPLTVSATVRRLPLPHDPPAKPEVPRRPSRAQPAAQSATQPSSTTLALGHSACTRQQATPLSAL